MSNYLLIPGSFEEKVSKGALSTRSKELKALIEAIRNYVADNSESGIVQVNETWKAWKKQDPKEFSSRGIPIALDFEREIAAELEGFGTEDDDAEDEWSTPIAAPRTVVVNLHKGFKKTGKAALTKMGNVYSVAEKGVSLASGVGAKAALIGGAGAMSATGVGGLVVGGVATVATVAFAISSYRKTGSHVRNLVELWNHRNDPVLRQCNYANAVANPLWEEAHGVEAVPTDATGHEMVANQVLPYIIRQKSRKLSSKKVAAIPVFGMGGTVVSAGKNLWKRAKKTKGIARTENARWLANHFCECECELSKNIVAELYSVEEMQWLLIQEPEKITPLLAEKMQAT